MKINPDFQLWEKADYVPLSHWTLRRRFRLTLADALLIAAMVAAVVVQVIR